MDRSKSTMNYRNPYNMCSENMVMTGSNSAVMGRHDLSIFRGLREVDF